MRWLPQPGQLAIDLTAFGRVSGPPVSELSSAAGSTAAGVGAAGTATPEMV